LSSLTLVKGTLKLMAWTKAKTAAVAGVAALGIIGAGTVAYHAVNTARTQTALKTMEGNWAGTLDVGRAKYRLVINVFQTNDAYVATIDSVDQGVRSIPFKKLVARTDSLHAMAPALAADYQATLNSDRTELSGTWSQVGKSWPLAFKRLTEADKVPGPLAASDVAPKAGSDLQGEWEGALKVTKDMELRLKLKIAEPTPGTFQAELDSVDQGAKGMPVTSLTYKRPAIRFELGNLKAAFEGNLAGGGEQLVGNWKQGRKPLPLTFQRVKTDAAAPLEKDYRYQGDFQLQGHWRGQLTLPSGSAMRIVFHIPAMTDGVYTAALDSPDQGAMDIPANSVEFNFPNVRIEWKALRSVYEGSLKSGKLVGNWRQGPATLALEMERDPN